MSVISRRFSRFHLRGSHLCKPLRRAKTVESITLRYQLRRIGSVQVFTVALTIGPVWSAAVRPFIPV